VDLPDETASTSNQPICHNTPDRPTDGIGDITYTNTHLRSIGYSDAAKNVTAHVLQQKPTNSKQGKLKQGNFTELTLPHTDIQPEVNKVSQRRQRWTKPWPWPQATCTKDLVKFSCAIYELCEQTDRQTDTDVLITKLRTPL